MAFPGRADITIGLRDEFTSGVKGVRNELQRLDADVKQVGGTMPQGFNRGREAADRMGNSVRRVTVDTKAMTLSMVGLGTTMIGLATATSRLGQAENRLEKSKVAVRRINDQIASTQKNLNRLIDQGKTNTEDYAVQLGRLETAYVDLETKQTDIKLNQDVLNDTYILFATTIVNTAINSIFLLRSSFQGLTLAQIKSTLSLGGHASATAVSTGAMGAMSVSTGVATGMTHAFGAALKAAFPPLIAITAAFAAWEGLIAPYIKEQNGVNLSLIDYADSVFGAKKSLESTNPILEEYKRQLGDTADEQEELNDATNDFTKLATPVKNAVQFQIEALKNLQTQVKGNTTEWLVLQRTMNQVRQSAGIPQGFQAGGKTAQSVGGTGLSPFEVLGGGSGTAGNIVVAGSGGSSVLTKSGGGTVVVQATQSAPARIIDTTGIPQRLLSGGNLPTVGGTPTILIEVAEKVVDDKLRMLGLVVKDNIIFYKGKKIAGGNLTPPDDFFGKLVFASNPAAFRSAEIFSKPNSIFGKIGFPAGSNPFFPEATSLQEITAQLSKFPPGITDLFGGLLQAQLSGDFGKAGKIRDNIENLLFNIDPKTGLPRPPPESGDTQGIIRDNLSLLSEGTGFGAGGANLEVLAESSKDRLDEAKKFSELAARYKKLEAGATSVSERRHFRAIREDYQNKAVTAARQAVFLNQRATETFGLSGRSVTFQAGIPVKFRPHQTNVNLTNLTNRVFLGSATDELNRQRTEENTNFFRTAFGKGDLVINEDGLISASGQRGFISNEKKERNRNTLRRLREEQDIRNIFLNSEEFLIQQQLRALSLNGQAGNFIMSRTQSNIIKRGGGLQKAAANMHVLGNIFNTPQTIDILSPISTSFSDILGAFNAIGRHSIQEIIRAAANFNVPSHITRDPFTPSNLQFLGSRITEFITRSVEGRPIWVREVKPFAEKIGIPKERLAEVMTTLKTNVSTEFFADNIDTRNEVLRLEARAYYIEREERSAVA